MLATILLACAPAEVEDAGDPRALDAFDEGDAPWSDLADAGWANVPGQYNVLLDADAADAPELREAVLARLEEAEMVGALANVPAFTARMGFADAARLAADPWVLAVEPDWLAHADARPGSTACATNSSQTVPDGVAALGEATSTGAGVAVAILDTGIDTRHRDLAVAGVVDFTGSRGGGTDDHGHGTHVAGTVAALDDGRGVVGVAPDVALWGVKVLDRRGSGSYSVIATGLDWAVDNGMDVVNMSLSGSTASDTLHAAVTAAHRAGVVQVVAAGNSGYSATKAYPAAYDGEVLTVSAYNVATGTFPSWSNYGVPPVDVAAPGTTVCSTTMDGSWGTKDGTSMAAPHVAGAVAVWLETHPGAPFADVEAALEQHVRALSDTSTHAEDLAQVSGW